MVALSIVLLLIGAAVARPGHCLEPRRFDRLTAVFARAVGTFLNATKRVANFLQRSHFHGARLKRGGTALGGSDLVDGVLDLGLAGVAGFGREAVDGFEKVALFVEEELFEVCGIDGHGFSVQLWTVPSAICLSHSYTRLKSMSCRIAYDNRGHPKKTTELNIQTAQAGYAAFKRGDIPGVIALLEEQIEWVTPEIAGIPGYGVHRGHAGVVDFFKAVNEHWDFEVFDPQEYIASGDVLAVTGYVRVKSRKTGMVAESDWVMVWQFRNGKCIRFQEYTDTAALSRASTGRAQNA